MKANRIKNLALSTIMVFGTASCGSDEMHNHPSASREAVQKFITEARASEVNSLLLDTSDVETKSEEIISTQIDLSELKVVFCTIQKIKRDDGSTILAGSDALNVALGFLADPSFDFNKFKSQKALPECTRQT